jgi:Fanconi anemia group M protein
MLDAGDYVFGDFAIERKELNDLHNSIIDGRYWSQVKMLKENYPHPVIIIEGDKFNTSKKSRMGNRIFSKKLDDGDRKTISGIENSTLVKWGVPFVNTLNYEDTVNHIVGFYEMLNRESSSVPPRAIVKKSKNVDEIRINCLQCVDGVGPTIASRIFNQFNWEDIVSMTDISPLMSVKGMTEIVAKRLIEVF